VVWVAIEEQEKGSRFPVSPWLVNGSGGRIRTCDLWVMSPTSYRTAPPRVMYRAILAASAVDRQRYTEGNKRIRRMSNALSVEGFGMELYRGVLFAPGAAAVLLTRQICGQSNEFDAHPSVKCRPVILGECEPRRISGV